jgi:Protein of unknown function (DUF3662)/FHA domain
MALLRSIESKIEGLFEGVFGRAFRTHVQPIELARKLVKEMDDHRSVSVSRVYVPNEYSVYLSPQDRRQFSGYEGSLVGELQEYLAEHARREGYSLLTPPRVVVHTDRDLAVGEFGIGTRLAAGEASAEAPPPPELPLEAPEHTMVYRAPADAEQEQPEAEPPSATVTLGGKTRTITAPRAVLGRSRECDVRVSDANVSRRHAEIRYEGDTWWVVDLGSTNGTLLNGKRAAREPEPLSDGDTITLGSTEIVFGDARP